LGVQIDLIGNWPKAESHIPRRGTSQDEADHVSSLKHRIAVNFPTNVQLTGEQISSEDNFRVGDSGAL